MQHLPEDSRATFIRERMTAINSSLSDCRHRAGSAGLGRTAVEVVSRRRWVSCAQEQNANVLSGNMSDFKVHMDTMRELLKGSLETGLS